MASKYQPMDGAPKDGATVVWIKTDYGEVQAYYNDCAWLRENGDEDIADCWRPIGGCMPDIELEDALGWRPIT